MFSLEAASSPLSCLLSSKFRLLNFASAVQLSFLFSTTSCSTANTSSFLTSFGCSSLSAVSGIQFKKIFAPRNGSASVGRNPSERRIRSVSRSGRQRSVNPDRYPCPQFSAAPPFCRRPHPEGRHPSPSSCNLRRPGQPQTVTGFSPVTRHVRRGSLDCGNVRNLSQLTILPSSLSSNKTERDVPKAHLDLTRRKQNTSPQASPTLLPCDLMEAIGGTNKDSTIIDDQTRRFPRGLREHKIPESWRTNLVDSESNVSLPDMRPGIYLPRPNPTSDTCSIGKTERNLGETACHLLSYARRCYLVLKGILELLQKFPAHSIETVRDGAQTILTNLRELVRFCYASLKRVIELQGPKLVRPETVFQTRNEFSDAFPPPTLATMYLPAFVIAQVFLQIYYAMPYDSDSDIDFVKELTQRFSPPSDLCVGFGSDESDTSLRAEGSCERLFSERPYDPSVWMDGPGEFMNLSTFKQFLSVVSTNDETRNPGFRGGKIKTCDLGRKAVQLRKHEHLDHICRTELLGSTGKHGECAQFLEELGSRVPRSGRCLEAQTQESSLSWDVTSTANAYHSHVVACSPWLHLLQIIYPYPFKTLSAKSLSAMPSNLIVEWLRIVVPLYAPIRSYDSDSLNPPSSCIFNPLSRHDDELYLKFDDNGTVSNTDQVQYAAAEYIHLISFLSGCEMVVRSTPSLEISTRVHNGSSQYYGIEACFYQIQHQYSEIINARVDVEKLFDKYDSLRQAHNQPVAVSPVSKSRLIKKEMESKTINLGSSPGPFLAVSNWLTEGRDRRALEKMGSELITGFGKDGERILE